MKETYDTTGKQPLCLGDRIQEAPMPKNRLMQILIVLNPLYEYIAYDDLYNNFVELLEQEAGAFREEYFGAMDDEEEIIF